jgi:Ca-activated chloride channel homolog
MIPHAAKREVQVPIVSRIHRFQVRSWRLNPGVTSPAVFRAFSAPLLLGLTILAFTPYTQSQSVDDVHVLPREGTLQPEPSMRGPSNRDGTLNERQRRLRVDVDLVLVPVAVADGENRPVTDLKQPDFMLLEGEQRQQIQYFSKEDAPISVGLILDVSKSMSNKIDTERAALAEFFKNANPEDDYFVITLSDRPRVIADSTQSFDEINNKLGLVIPNGNTALLDGIYLGVAKMRSARYQRRALLIISDGGDNHSRYRTREIKDLVQEAGVLIYSIGIFDNMPVPVFKSIEEKLGSHLLTEITEATGGRTIAADSRDKVPAIAATVSRELREQYLLGYRSSNASHDGKWRKIKVKVSASTGVPPLRAYYKPGYYAPER